MPTATLSFNLPEDKQEFDDARTGSRWRSVIVDLDEWLRSKNKYESEKYPKDALAAFAHVRDELFQLLNDNRLDISE